MSAIDYWGESAKINPFTHTWSLGVEEQFYLVFPLLISLTVLGTWSTPDRARLKLWIGLLSAISLGMFISEARFNASSAYYLLNFRFWELGVGCFLYLALSEGRLKRTKSIGSLAGATFSLIALIATLCLPASLSAVSTPLAVAFTALLIAFVQLSHSRFTMLDNKILVGVGLISYSLYLWHWPIIVIGRMTIGVDAKSIPVLLLIIVLASAASYFYVEKPLRSALRLKSKKQIGFTVMAF
ncbi:MAG: acyltransferase [Halioglobus sp.]